MEEGEIFLVHNLLKLEEPQNLLYKRLSYRWEIADRQTHHGGVIHCAKNKDFT